MMSLRRLLLFIALLPLCWPAEGGLKSPGVIKPELEDLVIWPPGPFSSEEAPNDDIQYNFLSATLGSNMVIQRDKEAVLWGYSKSGATITTSLYSIGRPPFEEKATAKLRVKTTAGDDGLWRQKLVAQPASLEPQSITIKSDNGESATLENVLFGDVYLCGGQSNMQFSIPGTTNATEEAQRANEYPHIRLFTVGQGTAGTDDVLMPDLQTVEQNWSVARNDTVHQGPKQDFGYFSSVCWFFGREVADGLGNQVPIGLISSNWGGTKIELWKKGGHLYNAMIYPFMVGPMSLTGFTWYQGEADTGNPSDLHQYGKNIQQMIEEWRGGFNASDAYFGYVQLSTWCPKNPQTVAEMRQRQMAAMQLTSGKIGYATNADHGFGCNIHPPSKQFCAARLGRSALAVQYGHDIHWKSPSYKQRSKQADLDGECGGKPCVVIELQDVSEKGLYVLDRPYNGRLDPAVFTCEGQIPGTCAGAEVLLNGKGWVNASVSIQSKDQVLLTAVDGNKKDAIVATSYGWASVPMLSIYDAGTDLPVLAWRGSF